MGITLRERCSTSEQPCTGRIVLGDLAVVDRAADAPSGGAYPASRPTAVASGGLREAAGQLDWRDTTTGRTVSTWQPSD